MKKYFYGGLIFLVGDGFLREGSKMLNNSHGVSSLFIFEEIGNTLRIFVDSGAFKFGNIGIGVIADVQIVVDAVVEIIHWRVYIV